MHSARPRLQAATPSAPGEEPILLRLDRDAGHRQGKPLEPRVRDLADQRISLRRQLGLLK